MDVQVLHVQVSLPLSGWDIFPLPTVASNADQYELVISFHLPSFPLPTFLAKFFQTEPDPEKQDSASAVVRYEPEESFLVQETRRLLELGTVSLCDEGVGGTYFIKSPEGSLFSIFKPTDEEPGAPNNPKNIVKNPLMPYGGGAVREVAAYLLDKDHLAGVPETQMLSKVSHKGFHTSEEKCGSVQRFVENDGDSSSFGCSVFPVEDVHRIGLLDVRIYNLDRNGENMLVRKEAGQLRLVPIDHTYSLPSVHQLNGPFFEWQYWPQAKQPFSQKTQEYIDSIDIEKDSTILRSLGIAEDSIRTMVVSTTLLKEASTAGWTLFDIACFMSRGIPLEKPSKFEDLIAECMTMSSYCPDSTDYTTDRERWSLFLGTFKQKLQEVVSTSERKVTDCKIALN